MPPKFKSVFSKKSNASTNAQNNCDGKRFWMNGRGTAGAARKYLNKLKERLGRQSTGDKLSTRSGRGRPPDERIRLAPSVADGRRNGRASATIVPMRYWTMA